MNREEMIEKLVNDDISTIQNAMYGDDTEYLCNILKFGIGYDNQTIEDIKLEFESRTWEGEEL